MKNSFIIPFVFLFGSLAYSAGGVRSGTFFNKQTGWYRNGSTLDLDFAGNQYYLNGTTYSTIASFIIAVGGTFTRGSSASYFDSAGTLQSAASDTPRLNYDSATLAPRGILIEESSTNVVKYSASLTTSPWVKGSPITLTAAAATAPDGTTTATLASADGSGLSSINQSSMPAVASTTITRSIFVKAGTTNYFYWQFNDSTNCGSYCVAVFNLSAKTASWLGSFSAQGPATITALKNGWFRVSATFTYSSAGVTDYLIYIGAYGNGTGSLYLWGAQQEAKAFVSSYIPTPGNSTVMRSADVFSMPTSGWFNATTGTFLGTGYGQLNSNQVGYGRILGANSGAAFLAFNGSGSSGGTTYNGSGQGGSGSIVYPTSTLTTPVKMATAWDQGTTTNSFAVSSSVLFTGSYTGNWSYSTIYPGGSNYNPLGAEVSRITFFPVRMPDGYLKNMTQ